MTRACRLSGLHGASCLGTHGMRPAPTAGSTRFAAGLRAKLTELQNKSASSATVMLRRDCCVLCWLAAQPPAGTAVFPASQASKTCSDSCGETGMCLAVAAAGLAQTQGQQ
jgi:hypothetical protein